MQKRHMQQILGAIAMAALGSGWLGADASAMVITQTLTSSSADVFFRTADSGVLSDQTTNYSAGAATHMRLGDDTFEYRGLIQFDLSQLATNLNNEVRSAYLQLRVAATVGTAADGDSFLSVYRMNSGWVDGNGSLTGTDATSGATWVYPDKANTGVPWTNLGVLGGTEVQGTATDSTDVIGEQFSMDGFTWVQWDVTADLQAFGEGTNNFGWLLVPDEIEGFYTQFSTREIATATIRPRLVISQAVPEPTAISWVAALLLGGLLLHRNRMVPGQHEKQGGK